MSNQMVVGSLGAISQNANMSLAESFVSAELILLVDCSGSMGAHDLQDGLSRYDRACKELSLLQGNNPGKLAVISFSGSTVFCPSGIPANLQGGTNLAQALRFIKVADVTGMRFILISDGQPNDPNEALAVARTFKNHIDVIYIGPEGGSGREFLERLARATGGQQVTADCAKQLAASVQTLLLKG